VPRRPRPPASQEPITAADLIAQRRLYPVDEAARLLGMHRVTLYHRAREGQIQFLKVGGRTYVAADEIERFILRAQPATISKTA
jgi:excisionase family DNA binding protein